MTEACDINNFPPCGDMCARARYEGVPAPEAADVAGQYLVFFAADGAGDVVGEKMHEMTDRQVGTAFSYEHRDYMGGVSLCSGRIGLGRCAAYAYDNEVHNIVPRQSAETLDAVRSAE